MHAIKRGLGFEGEWGGVSRRVWREQREGQNAAILLQSQI